MAFVIVSACLLAAVMAAPPPTPRQIYPQPGTAQLQQLNTLDYYLDNPEVQNYYNQAQQKQGVVQSNQNGGSPSRLESLEPDSEVEILPGAQQPQQPPQQNPVNPNIPGLIPGQRVYIVHMPIPGYRPGTVGGYQPVYVYAAAPSGQPNYVQGGYQNAILVDPSGQGLISPVLGYQRPGFIQQGANPGYVLAGQSQPPYGANRPYDLLYQDPTAPFGYQAVNGVGPNAAGGLGGQQGPVRFSQLVQLQQAQPGPGHSNPQGASSEKANQTVERSRIEEGSEAESKEEIEEPQRNSRPVPPHARAQQKKA